MEHAKALARETGVTYIPPFDHHFIVEGQGVAGLEVLDQVSDFDSVVIPVGGGGYAAGVATAIKAKRPDVFILGVCSEWAIRARQLKEGGKSLIPEMTIADGIGNCNRSRDYNASGTGAGGCGRGGCRRARRDYRRASP